MDVSARSVRLLALVLVAGCSGGPGGTTGDTTTSVAQASAPPALQVVFRDGRVFAREGDREWPIAEVGRDDMLWAPDGERFAYLRRQEPTSRPTAAAEPQRRPGVRSDAGKGQQDPMFHIVVRNIRGDSVNEFPVYRDGRPSQLDWVDNETLGYLAPPDRSGDAYVLHSARTGEILAVHRGTRFVWSPGRRQLAYVSTGDGQVRVDERVVWPRGETASDGGRRRKASRSIEGKLIWSPDGAGLAFMAVERKKPTLVVLLVVDNPGGDLSWPLPRTALLPGNELFWGDSKVVIGESMLKPRFAASWKRIR
ncbi:MAG: hypothetical protein JRI55_24690 [Deltaproteobacteria bacterium]|jgi:hypothetical protein|nr:hypothetical protein [Deltaproteobacteria bacterium]